MPALFITGTGTDVGKTFVATALIRAARAHGRTVDALKPVVSGFDPASPHHSDPARLLAALGRPLDDAAIASIAPFRFRAPLSPNVAARMEQKSLDFQDVAAACRGWLATSAADMLLIESAGGVMSPIDDHHTGLDLIAALRLPVLLVAGSYLGSISHTLTALEALSRQCAVRAIVVSDSAAPPMPLDLTLATLSPLSNGVPVMGLPRSVGEPDPMAGPVRALWKACVVA